MAAVLSVLPLAGCAAIGPTPGPQDAAPMDVSTKSGEYITPEIPNLKPFPPEEPPAVITAGPDYGSAN
jgi:hypothetical protein